MTFDLTEKCFSKKNFIVVQGITFINWHRSFKLHLLVEQLFLYSSTIFCMTLRPQSSSESSRIVTCFSSLTIRVSNRKYWSPNAWYVFNVSFYFWKLLARCFCLESIVFRPTNEEEVLLYQHMQFERPMSNLYRLKTF